MCVCVCVCVNGVGSGGGTILKVGGPVLKKVDGGGGGDSDTFSF